MPMMTIFEPLFLLLFVTAVATLIAAAAAALQGQRPRAARILRRLAIGTGAYLAIVLIVAWFSAPVSHRVGEPMCFDDWCITVLDATRTPVGAGQSWRVTLRISSRAKRVDQRENGAAVYLTDSRQRRFDPDPAVAAVPLDSRLAPGEAIEAPRIFTLPSDATGVELVFAHEGGFPIGEFIIGENQLFHKASTVKLD